jgi:hypothetical protein
MSPVVPKLVGGLPGPVKLSSQELLGSDVHAMIAKTGDIWRSWGWYVYQRDGFEKPNQFGYAPDGYRLQIVAAYPPDYPPTVSATSPCFAGEIARDDIAFPAVLKGD